MKYFQVYIASHPLLVCRLHGELAVTLVCLYGQGVLVGPRNFLYFSVGSLKATKLCCKPCRLGDLGFQFLH